MKYVIVRLLTHVAALRHCGVMPTTDPDELLTAPQAGVLLKCSYRTAIRLMEQGLLPRAHKLPGPNGAYLFKRSDVEKLAAQRTEAAS